MEKFNTSFFTHLANVIQMESGFYVYVCVKILFIYYKLTSPNI